MAAFATLPVYLRIGDSVAEIATIDFPVHGNGTMTVDRKAIADMLRAAADAYENPPAEEVPDASA